MEQARDEVTRIKQWAIENNISQISLQKLMDILRNMLPQLPLSVKTFLRTNFTFDIETFVDAEGEQYQYVYFGLSKTAKMHQYRVTY